MKERGPPLLILSGAPGAGKTRLAPHLAAALGLPVIAKDAIKEALMDHVGGGPEVGAAAFAVQFAVAETLLTGGQGVILEGAFFRDSPDLTRLAAVAAAVVVHPEAPLETLLERYRRRAPGRHLGHRGLEALSDLRERES